MASTVGQRNIRSVMTGLARRVGLAAPAIKVTPSLLDPRLNEVSLRLNGRQINVLVRPNTCDLDLVSMILTHDSEYRLPSCVQPKVIFDIGANIGITALYFHSIYPDAQIFCFEPLPDNVELLSRNTQDHSDHIHVIAAGVSDVAGTLEYFPSNDPRNFGGGSFMRLGDVSTKGLKLPVITVEKAIQLAGVDHVDVFKIDTEGSELPILRGIGLEMLNQAQAVVGELHGQGDWEACHMLSTSHDLGIEKRFDRRCFNFIAVRKDLTRSRRAAA